MTRIEKEENETRPSSLIRVIREIRGASLPHEVKGAKI
jgi:hypothetical protein